MILVQDQEGRSVLFAGGELTEPMSHMVAQAFIPGTAALDGPEYAQLRRTFGCMRFCSYALDYRGDQCLVTFSRQRLPPTVDRRGQPIRVDRSARATFELTVRAIQDPRCPLDGATPSPYYLGRPALSR